MTKKRNPERTDTVKNDNFAVCCFVFVLAFTGGFADASTFLLLGVFSGHLTGNSVLSLIQLIQGSYAAFFISLTALAGFVSGTVAGILCRRMIRQERNAYLLLALQLFLIAAVIVLLKTLGTATPGNYIFAAMSSFALGIQNGGFGRVLESKVHTSYITGTTTSFFQSWLGPELRNAEAKLDRRLHALIPCAFVLGAGAGAFLTDRFHIGGFMMLIPLIVFSTALCRRYSF